MHGLIPWRRIGRTKRRSRSSSTTSCPSPTGPVPRSIHCRSRERAAFTRRSGRLLPCRRKGLPPHPRSPVPRRPSLPDGKGPGRTPRVRRRELWTIRTGPPRSGARSGQDTGPPGGDALHHRLPVTSFSVTPRRSTTVTAMDGHREEGERVLREDTRTVYSTSAQFSHSSHSNSSVEWRIRYFFSRALISCFIVSIRSISRSQENTCASST